MGVHRMGHPVEGHALNDPRYAEAVVAVEMREADPGDVGDGHAGQGHLPLTALARVEEQALAVPPDQVAVVAARLRRHLARGAEHG